MASALREDVAQWIAVVDRHDPRAQLVVRRVQRERQPDRLVDLVDEPPQAGKPPDAGDRRPPVRDPDVGQPPRSCEHLVEVQHRLAHPHEDRVVDRLETAEVERLVEDLGRGQIPPERHLAGCAERARQRAAGLRREAERAAPVAVAHEHGFDRVAVGGREQRLHGAVPRGALGLDGQGRERNRSGELVAERPRQVRHRLVAARPARRPVPHLAGAVGGLAAVAQRRLEERQVHAGHGSESL